MPLSPSRPGKVHPLSIIGAIGVFGLLVAAVVIPQPQEYETYCTPRTSPGQESTYSQPQPPPDAEVVSQSETETCYRRPASGEDGFGK